MRVQSITTIGIFAAFLGSSALHAGELPTANTSKSTPAREELRIKQLNARALRYGKAGRFDEMVECLVLTGPHAIDDPCWAFQMELMRNISARARKQFPEFAGLIEENLLWRDFDEKVRQLKPKALGPASVEVPDEKFKFSVFACAESIFYKQGRGRCILLSNGTIRFNEIALASSSFIVSGASIKAQDITNSVVICDGDLTMDRGAGNSVIVARGTVTLGRHAVNTLIITEGGISFRHQLFANSPTMIAKDHVAKPLGFVSFFDCRQIGLLLVDPLNEVKVKDVTEGSTAAWAGIRPGDVLLSVGGKDGFAIEEFRRLLRRASVQDDTVIKLRRGDKIMEVTLDFRPLHKKDEEAEAKQKETEPKK